MSTICSRRRKRIGKQKESLDVSRVAGQCDFIISVRFSMSQAGRDFREKQSMISTVMGIGRNEESNKPAGKAESGKCAHFSISL